MVTTMKTINILLIIVAALILANSCNGPTEPELQPGRRDYTWQVDTIKPGNESLSLGRIWGSSPNDVWAVGSSSWTATSIWHYNGKQWRCDSIPRKVGANGLFGISQNDVWLGSCCGLNTIWHYNGNNWYQYAEIIPEDGYNQITINYFDGMSASNIYGVGFTEQYGANKWKALVMQYNGNVWRFVSMPNVRVSFETVVIENKTGILVMSGTDFDPSYGFIAKIYYLDGEELKELLSESGWSFVTKLGNEIFATMNSSIYKYENKKLVPWKNNFETPINGNIICGRSRNDFFIGAYGGIAHYNGNDFQIICKTEPNQHIEIRRGVIFEKDVFFIAQNYTLGRNLIIRGKLN
jgi:hypothetical protein